MSSTTVKSPYKFISTTTKESVTCPGVDIVLRKLTEGRRVELRESLKENSAKTKALFQEMETINQAGETGEVDSIRLAQIQLDITQLMYESDIAFVKWGVKRIENLLDENEERLDIADLDKWPSQLFRECLNLVKQEAGISGEDAKNSESPTTSSEPVGAIQ